MNIEPIRARDFNIADTVSGDFAETFLNMRSVKAVVPTKKNGRRNPTICTIPPKSTQNADRTNGT